ncbi:hypothetical protein PYCCODRAFT_1438616 [Trametes coccinea BRFM310]|uniref:Uncharacterized protein n=1 Tax=Trametes coccinea (strain BRFM310) TaxID=1353009 RepID=A0A1Y2IDI9_TRAC3|nr:hypothetical protein PYCCODRAFT_1438616 [Trametes coccinea BRFM310]
MSLSCVVAAARGAAITSASSRPLRSFARIRPCLLPALATHARNEKTAIDPDSLARSLLRPGPPMRIARNFSSGGNAARAVCQTTAATSQSPDACMHACVCLWYRMVFIRPIPNVCRFRQPACFRVSYIFLLSFFVPALAIIVGATNGTVIFLSPLTTRACR